MPSWDKKYNKSSKTATCQRVSSGNQRCEQARASSATREDKYRVMHGSGNASSIFFRGKIELSKRLNLLTKVLKSTKKTK